MAGAIDTVLGVVTMASSAAKAALVAATGDSFTIRNFPQTQHAWLDQVAIKSAASATLNITSPLLHDDVEGIQIITAEAPSELALPRQIQQLLYPQDTLTVQALGGNSDVIAAILGVYYDGVPGLSARLYNPGDVAGMIQNIKVLEVAMTTAAAAGAWETAVFTTTENLLKANTDYAVLGYISDVAVLCVGLQGTETGNLKIAGPGTTRTFDTSEFFVQRSLQTGRPHIPVINAANSGSLYAVAADSADSTAVKVQLILGQLSQNLPS